MKLENEIKELEKARRKSKKKLPFLFCYSILGLLFIWCVKMSHWQIGIVLFLTVGFLLLEILKVVYCGYKLKMLQNSHFK
jgi:hypothetical protein